MRLKTDSIAAQVALALVTVTTVVLSAFGVLAWVSVREQLQAGLRGATAVNAERLAAGLALAAWNIDRDQIDRVIESAMADGDVFAVEVQAAGGKHSLARDASGAAVPGGGPRPPGLIAEERIISFGGKPVGTVRVLGSAQRIEGELRRGLRWGLGVIALLDLILTAGIYLVLRRAVLRPLTEVDAFAVAVSSEGAGGLTLRSKRYSGELESLRASVERMVALLGARYQVMLESERKYRALFNGTSDAIFVREVTPGGGIGRFTEVNDLACTRLGYSREELLQRTPADIDLTGAPAEASRRLREEGSAVFETTHTTKDGHTIPVELNAHHIELGGKPVVLTVARDITARKALEQRLLQSQKMEAMGLLAGGVAHDFNNMLTVILGHAAILKMDIPAGAPMSEEIDQVIEAGQRAANLTRSLLAFGRKQVIEPQVVDLCAVVRNVEKFLVRVIGEDIHLKTRFPGHEASVRVDVGQLEQTLVNLATNARDAMPKGGLLSLEIQRIEADELFAQAQGLPGPGAYALLAVSDTGTGMDAATRQRIFEPFFTTKQPGKGTGLGLAIAYGVVQQHNGQISVYSEPGVGTTFRIYLPLASGAASSPGEPVAAAPPPSGTETILVAEDEPSVRRFVESILRRYGYQVIVAEDGQDAVEKFAANRERVQFVLLDMIMPRRNGKSAYDEIRRLAPAVKVLFTSGYTADIIQTRGELDRGVELLMKPALPRELLAKIREMLDAK